MCAELEEAGTFMAGGVFAGSRASAVIVEAGSHEELSRLLQSLPFWSLMKMNITPIQSFADRAEQESKAADIFDQLREAGELPW
jgi:muconolactone delta-isomerase